MSAPRQRNKEVTYSIIFENGRTININATAIEWFQSDKMARFLHGNDTVARVNMSNVVGWAKTDCIVENKEEKEE